MRVFLGLTFVALSASAQTRFFNSMPSSNGHGAVMADVTTGRIVHFREHLAATEEPQLDAQGLETWVGNQPQIVKTRDLLFDAYFGLRVAGQQRWLPGVAVEAPDYEQGLVTWTQKVSGLEVTTWVFAPRGLAHAGFVALLRVKNLGAAAVPGVSAFSLHNFHLGFGRPEPMANGETVVVAANRDLQERGFAGVVMARPLGPVAHALAWNPGSAQNGFQLVQAGGVTDFPDSSGDLGVADDWATGYQFDLGTLAAGGESWAGLVVAHQGNPFAAAEVQAWLDGYVAGRGPKQLLDDERAGWATFQAGVKVPPGLSADQQAVFRQSAVMLAMAQVREREAFLREWLAADGQPRKSRFPGPLPGVVQHRGFGAMLASLPPGEWTYAWVRDGAYAAAALSRLGLTSQARDALRFYLDAEGGRFQQWNELKPYAFPPYVVSLTRYTGFGVEETDFNAFGPNLEFDGFGLLLWALREHERRTGDLTLTDEKWTTLSTRVADPLLALIDPITGLVRKDSSIWESHWLGRERSWTFTSLTAARGLCDAAVLAERKADGARAMQYRLAGLALRKAIATKLTDANGALASNLEELDSKAGYFDAAALEAISLGLFDPKGRIATATLAAMESKLRATKGPGWSRNDDRTDHPGKVDLSPWGSEYDSAEWVFTDLRGAIAMRRNGNAARADALLAWVTSQALANGRVIPETFDETTGAWKFNAPMIGFGAGAYVLALADDPGDPACGAYFDETVPMTPDAGTITPPAPKGCGCGASPGPLCAFFAFAFLRARALKRP